MTGLYSTVPYKILRPKPITMFEDIDSNKKEAVVLLWFTITVFNMFMSYHLSTDHFVTFRNFSEIHGWTKWYSTHCQWTDQVIFFGFCFSSIRPRPKQWTGPRQNETTWGWYELTFSNNTTGRKLYLDFIPFMVWMNDERDNYDSQSSTIFEGVPLLNCNSCLELQVGYDHCLFQILISWPFLELLR